jgi:hypothetical protein
MAVICIGRSWLIDEASERRRFEAQLDRVGFRHEEFTLQVAPLSDPQRSAAAERRGCDVKVIHLPTRSVKAYRGGEDGDWVAAFANDLGNGLYGQSNEGMATAAGRRRERGVRSADRTPHQRTTATSYDLIDDGG